MRRISNVLATCLVSLTACVSDSESGESGASATEAGAATTDAADETGLEPTSATANTDGSESTDGPRVLCVLLIVVRSIERCLADRGLLPLPLQPPVGGGPSLRHRAWRSRRGVA